MTDSFLPVPDEEMSRVVRVNAEGILAVPMGDSLRHHDVGWGGRLLYGA